jgi:hypothetical protein
VSRGRVCVRGGRGGGWGGGAPPALGRTTVQDKATMLRGRQRSPVGQGGQCGGGGALKARGDVAEEEDGAVAAEPRRLGRPEQVRVEATRVSGADGAELAAWRGRGLRRISGGRRRWRIP